MAKTKEKYIENQILMWLNMQPHCFAFKVSTNGFYDTKGGFFRKNNSKFLIKGTADIIGVFHGRMLAIEVKSKEGYRKFTQNPGEHELNQIAFLMKVRGAGGIGICACSLEEVEQILKLERDKFKSYS
jgi:penicillin-binding protein-related factor A (putative recombinase)